MDQKYNILKILNIHLIDLKIMILKLSLENSLFNHNERMY